MRDWRYFRSPFKPGKDGPAYFSQMLKCHACIASHEIFRLCSDISALVQVANADFFLKTLPLFDAGDDVGMVLSPQSFYNVDTNQDIFNHGNIQFWEYAQHGYDAIGFISCTGASLPCHAPAITNLLDCHCCCCASLFEGHHGQRDGRL